MAGEPIEDQIAYYRAIAPEYEDHSIDEPGQRELLAAVAAFPIDGEVLELACGPGTWTGRLAAEATSLTAVEASPEMIDRARRKVADSPVRFVQADLFSWVPDRTYDSVFFGFWLSHVPETRFEGFWNLVAQCLNPSGRVFFVDDSYRAPDELIEGPDSHVVERRLKDGTPHRAIKVPHEPASLERRLRAMGWDIDVAGSGPFYWGTGARSGD